MNGSLAPTSLSVRWRLLFAFFGINAFAVPLPVAHAADLVVWWEEGWYPEEDRAVVNRQP